MMPSVITIYLAIGTLFYCILRKTHGHRMKGTLLEFLIMCLLWPVPFFMMLK